MELVTGNPEHFLPVRVKIYSKFTKKIACAPKDFLALRGIIAVFFRKTTAIHQSELEDIAEQQAKLAREVNFGAQPYCPCSYSSGGSMFGSYPGHAGACSSSMGFGCSDPRRSAMPVPAPAPPKVPRNPNVPKPHNAFYLTYVDKDSEEVIIEDQGDYNLAIEHAKAIHSLVLTVHTYKIAKIKSTAGKEETVKEAEEVPAESQPEFRFDTQGRDQSSDKFQDFNLRGRSQPTGGIFGNSAPTGQQTSFRQSNAQAPGNLFGQSTTAHVSIFGQQPQTTNVFSQNNTTGSSMFGNQLSNSQTSLFVNNQPFQPQQQQVQANHLLSLGLQQQPQNIGQNQALNQQF